MEADQDARRVTVDTDPGNQKEVESVATDQTAATSNQENEPATTITESTQESEAIGDTEPGKPTPGDVDALFDQFKYLNPDTLHGQINHLDWSQISADTIGSLQPATVSEIDQWTNNLISQLNQPAIKAEAIAKLNQLRSSITMALNNPQTNQAMIPETKTGLQTIIDQIEAAAIQTETVSQESDPATTIPESIQHSLENFESISPENQALVAEFGTPDQQWRLAKTPNLDPKIQVKLAKTGEPICWELSKRYQPLDAEAQAEILKNGNDDSRWRLSLRPDIDEAVRFGLLKSSSEAAYDEVVAQAESEGLIRSIKKEIEGLNLKSIERFIEQSSGAVVGMAIAIRPELITPTTQLKVFERHYQHPKVKIELALLPDLRPEIGRMMFQEYQKNKPQNKRRGRKTGDLEAIRSMILYQEDIANDIQILAIDDPNLFETLIDRAQLSPHTQVKIASHRSRHKRRLLATHHYIEPAAQMLLGNDSDKKVRLLLARNCHNLISELQVAFVNDPHRDVQIAFASHNGNIAEIAQQAILKADPIVRRKFAKNCYNIATPIRRALARDSKAAVRYALRQNDSLETNLEIKDAYLD